MAVKKDKNIQNLDTVGAYPTPVTPPKPTLTGGKVGFTGKLASTAQEIANSAPIVQANPTTSLAALSDIDPRRERPASTPKTDVTPTNISSNSDSYGYYLPTYTSPTAGAQYSYGGTRPTWSWDQTEPTYSWNQQAPTWSWDDSGRPGAFEWDDSGRPGEFQYDREAPTYNNAYQDRINAMVDQILNRPQFTYDYMQDPLYAQYADAYTRNGTQAMNDTLAQVSARTGGLASSYASNAAQQQYNSYMNALNDKIPELYQLAYGMYRDQGNDMRSNLSMLQGLENTDYGRYMDALGQYNTDRNLAYNVWNSGLNQYNQDRNFAYNQYADQLAQYNTDRNFSYGQYQDALGQYNNDRNFSFDQYQTALNQYNNNRNFDYGVYADALSQYNTDRNWDYNLWSDNIARQEAAAKAAYNSQVAAARAAAGASGGSGGSPSGSSDSGDQQAKEEPTKATPDIYADLYASGAKDFGVAKELAKYYAETYYPGKNKTTSSSTPQRSQSNVTYDLALELQRQSNAPGRQGIGTLPGSATVNRTVMGGYTFDGKSYGSIEALANAIHRAGLSDVERALLQKQLDSQGIPISVK